MRSEKIEYNLLWSALEGARTTYLKNGRSSGRSVDSRFGCTRDGDHRGGDHRGGDHRGGDHRDGDHRGGDRDRGPRRRGRGPRGCGRGSRGYGRGPCRRQGHEGIGRPQPAAASPAAASPAVGRAPWCLSGCSRAVDSHGAAHCTPRNCFETCLGNGGLTHPDRPLMRTAGLSGVTSLALSGSASGVLTVHPPPPPRRHAHFSLRRGRGRLVAALHRHDIAR